MTKKNMLFAGAFVLAVFILSSCSTSLRDKAVGTWKVKTVDVQADAGKYTQEQIEQTKEMEKSAYFVLNDDLTMNAVTSGVTLEGTWYAMEEEEEVFIRFEGSTGEATVLGKYQGGDLVKSHRLSGMVITTVYEKE